jgi:hypothetical protein
MLLCTDETTLLCVEETRLLCSEDAGLLAVLAAMLDAGDDIWLDDEELRLADELLSLPPQATKVKDTAASVANCGIC